MKGGSDLEEYPLAYLHCQESLAYIRANQRLVVGLFGFRVFDIHKQLEVARRLKEIRHALKHEDITLRDLGLSRLEWHYRVWWARKHRLLRYCYIRAQIFMLRRFPHLHRTYK